jgi:hypothetical protein
LTNIAKLRIVHLLQSCGIGPRGGRDRDCSRVPHRWAIYWIRPLKYLNARLGLAAGTDMLDLTPPRHISTLLRLCETVFAEAGRGIAAHCPLRLRPASERSPLGSRADCAVSTPRGQSLVTTTAAPFVWWSLSGSTELRFRATRIGRVGGRVPYRLRSRAMLREPARQVAPSATSASP